MTMNPKKFQDLSYTISCCKCGISIIPNCFNMCNRCRMSEINVLAGVKTKYILESCKKCERYHLPPKKWMNIDNKNDLLSFIFLRYKEIRDLPIVSTNFAVTEEHSKQIILCTEIEKENVKKSIKIHFKLKNKQCSDCDKVEAKQYWTSIVQVRQRSVSKRTFLFIEQSILKNKMFKNCSNIKERKDGMDFYYLDRKGPKQMISFLDSHIGTKTVQSNRLMTEDRNNNIMKYKFSYSVEIFPLCKDDLVIIDEELAKKKNVNRLLIVLRVTTKIIFIDPLTSKTMEINKQIFFSEKDSFRIIFGSKDLKLFTVTEIEKNYNNSHSLKHTNNHSLDCYITHNFDQQIHCKTHLTYIEEGDQIYGYDLGNCNLHFIDRDQFKVIIVRKKYENLGLQIKTDKEQDREYQFFLEDMLSDPDMRKNVDIFDKTNKLIESFDAFKIQ